MGKIVKFPGRPDVSIETPQGQIYKETVLLKAKEILEDGDYRDVLAGILDQEIYETLDDDLKAVVDVYYESLK